MGFTIGTSLDRETLTNFLQFIAQPTTDEPTQYTRKKKKGADLRNWEIEEPQTMGYDLEALAYSATHPNNPKIRHHAPASNSPIASFTPYQLTPIVGREEIIAINSSPTPIHVKGSPFVPPQSSYDQGREIERELDSNFPKTPFMGSGRIARQRELSEIARQDFTRGGSNGAFQSYSNQQNTISNIRGIQPREERETTNSPKVDTAFLLRQAKWAHRLEPKNRPYTFPHTPR